MAYRGDSLRALRERKNIKLRWIADETRIAVWYLDAIEEERFDRFPGRFYFRSFAGEYARSLGLDPGEALHDLQRAYDEWSHRQSNGTRHAPSPSGTSLISRLTGRIKRLHEA